MVLEAPLYMQANTYSARLDRQVLAALLGEGIADLAVGELRVGPRAAGANMSVDVAAGRAIIAGDDQAGQGSYFCQSTAVENLPIGAAPGSNSRIDLVVARVRDATVTGSASSDWILEVIPGAVAASPVAPAVPASAIPLAQVTVAAGATSIAAGNIADRRTQATLPIGNAAYVRKTGIVGATVKTAESTTSTTFADLATVGPSATATIGPSGEALVVISSLVRTSPGGAIGLVGIAIDGTQVGGDATTITVTSNPAGQNFRVSQVFRITAIVAGARVFKLVYRTTTDVASSTATFADRFLTVIPL